MKLCLFMSSFLCDQFVNLLRSCHIHLIGQSTKNFRRDFHFLKGTTVVAMKNISLTPQYQLSHLFAFWCTSKRMDFDFVAQFKNAEEGILNMSKV